MEIKDFRQWEEYNGNSMGSGRSEKIWLTFGDEIGLFKFPKQATDGTITYEHISEKLAYDIATLLDIPCAKIDIGTYNGRYGSMSYRINKSNEFLMEGISFINQSYPNYDIDKLYDPVKQVYYSFPIIYPIIKGLHCEREFVEMVTFDALIGNSDRHHSNWAVLVAFENPDELTVSYSPLYDNGSSLCSYIKEFDIDSFLSNDTRRILSLVTTKSKSRIRIDALSKKEPQHLAVLAFMIQNEKFRIHFIPFAEKVLNRLSMQNINKMLEAYPDDLVSPKRKELIRRFLSHKLIIIKTVLEKGG